MKTFFARRLYSDSPYSIDLRYVLEQHASVSTPVAEDACGPVIQHESYAAAKRITATSRSDNEGDRTAAPGSEGRSEVQVVPYK
jgi:hypothetical protein